MTRATVVLLLAMLPAAVAQAQDPGDLPTQLVRVLERINSGRHAAGLPPLARDAQLDGAAQAHSLDMATHDLLAHVSPRSGDPAARVAAAGARAQSLTENIAVEPTALAAHDRLVASDEHRANMLGRDTTHVGLGAARGARGIYLTELFADLTATPAVPVLPTPLPPASASVMAEPLRTPEASQVPAPTQAGGQIQVGQRDAHTTVAVQGGEVEGRRVVGYWVYSQGRWFYYPLPVGAQPGQVLAAAPMPPGVGPETYAAPAPVPAQQPTVYSAPYIAQPGGVYVMPRAMPRWRRW